MKKNLVMIRSVNVVLCFLCSFFCFMFFCCDGLCWINIFVMWNILMFIMVIIVNGFKKYKVNKVIEYILRSFSFSDILLLFCK